MLIQGYSSSHKNLQSEESLILYFSEVIDVIHYDWKWPRYGWLADQSRCVDLILGTFRNLTRHFGKIEVLTEDANARAEISRVCWKEIRLLDILKLLTFSLISQLIFRIWFNW